MRGCNICVNLIGILYEKKNGQFNKFHRLLPDLISKIASESDINQLVHISSLGIENAKDSIYASSKLNGEEAIKTNFERYVILKPSICYGSSDKFTTKFMSLLSLLPFMPLYYKGKTKFAPIHVSDFVEIIFQVIQKDLNNLTIECVGPEIMSFEKMLKTILKSIDKKRLLFPLPYQLAKLSAKLFQLMPEPLLTEDQLKLLKYDNILSGKYKTNFDLGFKSEKKFENEINKYSYNWRVGGQFSNKGSSVIMMTYIVIGICLILLGLVVYVSAKPISDGIEARRNIKSEISEVEEKDNNLHLTSDRDIPEELKKSRIFMMME